MIPNPGMASNLSASTSYRNGSREKHGVGGGACVGLHPRVGHTGRRETHALQQRCSHPPVALPHQRLRGDEAGSDVRRSGMNRLLPGAFRRQFMFMDTERCAMSASYDVASQNED
jgi:hypothetical protein